MASKHSCRRMPRGIEVADGGSGWRVRFPGGREWRREIWFCPFCGRRLGASSREFEERSRRKGQLKMATPVRCVETGEVFETQSQAAARYGCTQPDISRCARGTRETAGGMHWEYA